MRGLIQRYGTIAVASIAFVLSACNTFTDLRPVPDVYEGSETVVDRALVTLKAYGAAQETLIQTCDPQINAAAPVEACVPLLKAEQRVRPGVTATGLIAAEYADIDARIRELGPDAPADWLLASAEIAGRLAAAWDPIEADVKQLIGKAGDIQQ